MRGKRLIVLLTFNEAEALPKIFDRLPLSADVSDFVRILEAEGDA